MPDVTKRLFTEEAGAQLADILKQNNALLGVLASNQIDALMSDWDGVNRFVVGGLAQKLLNIGDTFTDNWRDTAAAVDYSVPWGVRHFKNVELQDGETVPGMVIQWNYATPFGVQFSHQRAVCKCPEGLAAGTHYFTLDYTWGSNVVKGDAVSFTLTKDVPVGGKIAGCYGAPDQPKSTWKIYVYSADGKELLETVTPTFVASGNNLGAVAYSTRNGNLNSMQEMAYGWNRWKTSAIRQWLNSDKPKGEWWAAQDEWDIAPDQLATKDGFLCGMPAALLKAIKAVKITTYTNTVQDGGEADITYDKVFLPSLEEMHINPQISGEGETWDYWLRASQQAAPLAQYGTYPQMITYAVENHASAQHVRLRSANRGDAYITWFVYASGYVNYSYASSAHRCAPACVIC